VKIPDDLSSLSLGKLADLLYAARDERLVFEKQVEALKAEETRIKEYIINAFTKDAISKVSGKHATLSITEKIVPRVKDWDLFWAYIARTRSFDLVQKRAAVLACQERWNAKKKLPGVEQFTLIDVSCTKL
jgi:hypothetical protein